MQQRRAEVLHGPNRVWKGKTGGRTLPLHPDLQAALSTLQGIFLRRRACTRWCISAPIWGPLLKLESALILPLRGTGSAHSTIPMETLFGVRLIEITKVGVDFRV